MLTACRQFIPELGATPETVFDGLDRGYSTNSGSIRQIQNATVVVVVGAFAFSWSLIGKLLCNRANQVSVAKMTFD